MNPIDIETTSDSIRRVFEGWKIDGITEVTLTDDKGRLRTWRKVQKEIVE